MLPFVGVQSYTFSAASTSSIASGCASTSSIASGCAASPTECADHTPARDMCHVPRGVAQMTFELLIVVDHAASAGCRTRPPIAWCALSRSTRSGSAAHPAHAPQRTGWALSWHFDHCLSLTHRSSSSCGLCDGCHRSARERISESALGNLSSLSSMRQHGWLRTMVARSYAPPR